MPHGYKLEQENTTALKRRERSAAVAFVIHLISCLSLILNKSVQMLTVGGLRWRRPPGRARGPTTRAAEQLRVPARNHKISGRAGKVHVYGGGGALGGVPGDIGRREPPCLQPAMQPFVMRFCSCAQVSSQAQSGQPPLLRRGRQHQVQRPDPRREQQPDREALRDLRLPGKAPPPSGGGHVTAAAREWHFLLFCFCGLCL